MDRELIRDVFDETGFSYKIESIKNDNNRVDMDIRHREIHQLLHESFKRNS